jgi:hypothetical protein
MLKSNFAIEASNEFILIDYISKRGFYDKSLREYACCKIKVKGNLIFNIKQPPQEYHMRINGKIVPYNDVDKILDQNAGEIRDFALIFANSIGVVPGEKSKVTVTGKTTKLIGKLVVKPIEETITIPQSSEIGEAVAVGDIADSGLVSQPPPPIPIELREKNMKILKEAYNDFLASKYSKTKIKKDADIDKAYNNKKIFVLKKHISENCVVIGQEGFYYIRKGKEYYYPWTEVKNIHYGRVYAGRKMRMVTSVLFWNDTHFKFVAAKYDQSEFASIKMGSKLFLKLFRKYWKPDFVFKETMISRML